ncbi:MAG: hypothetical protein PHR64_03065 [Candidatus Shapirobacteria bacterium]|jgi:hypothetical protein|nr:hypothetical protein [Candidatus Shapirobacteria bacterium]MDD5073948.1 hypothetical protein [Candidatus Shapirobacteria bacterium]MDD5481898.1 hypothetical protein [Candidatus Shapirobacteria bacterium]
MFGQKVCYLFCCPIWVSQLSCPVSPSENIPSFERDCQEIKEVFGRGQGFGEWNNPKLKRDKQALEKAGFEIIYAQDFFYNEFYPTYGDLDLFLQGVPIFEDFDSERDKEPLKTYIEKFKTNKGIKFPRHRIVIVAKKRS